MANMSWLILDKVLRMTVGLFVGVWIARYLGPEQFGIFNYALAITSIFGALAGMGLQSIIVRDLVQIPDNTKMILGSAALLHLFGSVIGFSLLIATIHVQPLNNTILHEIIIIFGLMMFFKISDIAVYYFEARVKSKYVILVQSTIFIVFSIVNIALLLNNAGLIAFSLVVFSESLSVAIVLLVVLSHYGIPILKLDVKFSYIKNLLRNSLPLLLSSVVLMIQARIDQVMLGQMVGEDEVSYYSVSLRIVEVFSVLAMILYSSFMPSLVSAKLLDSQIYLKKIETFYKLNIFISFIIMIPILLLSHWIILLLFGNDYLPAAPILTIMSIRILFAHLGIARSIYLLNENLITYSAMTMVIGTFINISLNLILIPEYKGIGAVIASAISFFVTILLVDLFYKKTRWSAKMMLRSIFTFYTILNYKP